MTYRALAGLAVLSLASAQQPKYDDANALLRPEGYREWVFVGSNLGIGYSDDGRDGSFKNIFIQPAMYKAYKKTGNFPDKTMLVMEVFTAGEKRPPAKVGKFEDKFRGIEVALKDESKFPEKWAYFNFIGDTGQLEKAKAFPKDACWNCHNQHAAADNVFVQFYPALRDK